MISQNNNKVPYVSVVLGSLQRLPFLKLTIESIRKELKDVPHEIIVVDGGSSDGSIFWLSSQKDVILILQHNRGIWKGAEIRRRSWGYFMNLGFKASKGKYICMVSDDCLIVPNAIKNGIEFFDRQLSNGIKIGALAFYWRNWPDQEAYSVGRTWGNNVFVNHGLYLKSALEAVDYADEDNYIFYHADGDLCLRLLGMGMLTMISPNSFIEHYCHAAEYVRYQNSSRQSEDWLAYQKRWGSLYGPSTVDWDQCIFQDKTMTSNQFLSIPSVKIFLLQRRLINLIKKYPASINYLIKLKITLLKLYGKIRY